MVFDNTIDHTPPSEGYVGELCINVRTTSCSKCFSLFSRARGDALLLFAYRPNFRKSLITAKDAFKVGVLNVLTLLPCCFDADLLTQTSCYNFTCNAIDVVLVGIFIPSDATLYPIAA